MGKDTAAFALDLVLQHFEVYVLSDFPGNRDYPGKSLRLTREIFFSLKVATYLDTAVTTFWENTTCRKNGTSLEINIKL